MAKVRSSSVRRNIDTSLSNSFSSSAASSLSASNYGVKTIRVFKNGDPYHQGIKFVLNRRYVHDLDKLQELLSEKLDLVHGVKRLYTANGKLVRQFQDIEDKQDYVAATNHFIPQPYGKSTNPVGHPFRGASPVNMPHTRMSRSQTRSSESRPSAKKRSQSGAPASAASQGINGKKAGTPEAKKKKKKGGKKKKKPEEEAPAPEAEAVLKAAPVEEAEPEPEAPEEAPEEAPAEAESPKEEVEAPESPKSDRPQTATKSPSPQPENGNDEAGSEHESNHTPTPTGSEHSGTEEEKEASGGNATDNEEEPISPTKENGDEKEAEEKGAESDKESKED